ncbi:uncharacterized protein V6R79_023907 [Siganus canaliculatus]
MDGNLDGNCELQTGYQTFSQDPMLLLNPLEIMINKLIKKCAIFNDQFAGNLEELKTDAFWCKKEVYH